ncbi:unnamed protein product [Hydatigera taeniaeformis]|uniref:Uncharacterized protein n=1 Tax=Hydatigena taeniaeformis TaxID=6205 RepID=A0A3P7FU07_HYDTA|nr:unnamed protein product [Hydatigera taeniaeformis]
MMKSRRTTKKTKAGDGDVFDEEYHPVDVMTRLQSDSHKAESGISESERVSIDRARRDVIQGRLCLISLAERVVPMH